MSHILRIVTWAACISAGLSFAACGVTAVAPPAPEGAQQASKQTTPLARKKPLSKCPCLYVASYFGGITVFPAGTAKKAKPVQQIIGSYTGLNGANDVAVDGSGNIYVANEGGNGVLVFAAGANGNASPVRAISGSYTLLKGPAGVALDSSDNIYVANNGSNTVTVYAAGANGNVAPIRTISGTYTGLNGPEELMLDANNNIYVPNDNNSLTVYAAGANGNVAPARTIAGNYTTLSSPAQVALDSSGNIYVANYNYEGGGKGFIAVFNAGANGNVPPYAVIAGAKTKLSSTSGVALDSSNNIYAANSSEPKGPALVTLYDPGVKGNKKPIAVRKGKAPAWDDPWGMAIR